MSKLSDRVRGAAKLSTLEKVALQARPATPNQARLLVGGVGVGGVAGLVLGVFVQDVIPAYIGGPVGVVLGAAMGAATALSTNAVLNRKMDVQGEMDALRARGESARDAARPSFEDAVAFAAEQAARRAE